MRRGEVCGLTWDCVDLDRETIYINKQLQQVPGHSGEFQLTPAKNGKGRTITVAAFVIDALKRHRVRQTEARLKAGPLWQEEGFVFTDEVGHRLSPNTVYHNYKRLVASIGLPEARLHDLRHSHVSLLIDMGFSALAIADRVGHESINITYQYAHLFPSKQIEMADRLNNEWQKGEGANDG